MTIFPEPQAANGWLVIDNVTSPRLQSEILKRAESDPRVDCVLLPFPKGDLICRKCGDRPRSKIELCIIVIFDRIDFKSKSLLRVLAIQVFDFALDLTDFLGEVGHLREVIAIGFNYELLVIFF